MNTVDAGPEGCNSKMNLSLGLFYKHFIIKSKSWHEPGGI